VTILHLPTRCPTRYVTLNNHFINLTCDDQVWSYLFYNFKLPLIDQSLQVGIIDQPTYLMDGGVLGKDLSIIRERWNGVRATHAVWRLGRVETNRRPHSATKTPRLLGWTSGCRGPRKGMYERPHVVLCPGRQEETRITWKMTSEYCEQR